MSKTHNNYQSPLPVDDSGFYGRFGGAYIPEILHRNVENLREAYFEAVDDPKFKEEFDWLMRHYVGRPSPLYYAKRLSERYGTNIYLKREDLNHTGAHKINNAIGSALLAKRMGKTRIIAETGAGQHGVATATVCALLGLDCVVYMGATDVARQQPNVERMKMLGAKVVPVTSGNHTLKDATNEAIRDWCCNPRDSFYIIGSTVGPHPYPEMVARFQSVISEEIRWQLKELTGSEEPDYVIACVGGGSNAAGAFYHFINSPKVKLIAAEAGGKGVDTQETAATIACGREGIIHGARTLVMQTADGQITEPYSISAGLDYPGIGPLHAFLAESKRSEVLAINDDEALRAAYLLTNLEGIIPALESAHALGVLDKKKFGKDDTVVVNLSGRGDKDMATYLRFREKFGPQTPEAGA
ncbi:MAG: tryptophan synthase subunit beta [Bacteroidales bacterium]|nr:tryptophan synthase subunit beta [Bacteroidales bacterium]